MLHGIMLLWEAVKDDNVPKLTNVLIGSILTGCGAFNLIEDIIDHHVLRLHVVQRSADPYNDS
jgi:uncharacterized membrane protein